MMKYLRLGVVLFLLIGSMVLSSAQQEQGVVKLPFSAGGLYDFNPLVCKDFGCSSQVELWNDLLFPRLFAIDHTIAYYTAGTFENNGLVQSWVFSEDNTRLTLNLRDDALWSDGQPITAYDVLYALQWNGLVFSDVRTEFAQHVDGVRPLDDFTIELTLNQGDCRWLSRLDNWVAPVHQHLGGYEAQARAFFDTEADSAEQWEAWLDTPLSVDLATHILSSIAPPFNMAEDYILNGEQIVTGGRYEVAFYDPVSELQLLPRREGPLIHFALDQYAGLNLSRAFTFDDSSAVYTNVPLSDVQPLTVAEAQFAQLVSNSWVSLQFNFADPRNPRPGFDSETGEPLEQGIHPVLADSRVREAIALAINVESIIQDDLLGQAVRLPGNIVPTSWAYDETLDFMAYDPIRSEELLHEAGWHQVGRQLMRECVDCLHAEEGRGLVLSIGVPDTLPNGSGIANSIVQNLLDVGINAEAGFFDTGSPFSQSFDLLLQSYDNTYPARRDYAFLASRTTDRFAGSRSNYISYYNDDIVALYDEAVDIQNCNLETRRDLYQQAQQLFLDDLVFVPLYAPTTTIAAQPNIQNFAPVPNDIYWNITEWIVWGD